MTALGAVQRSPSAGQQMRVVLGPAIRVEQASLSSSLLYSRYRSLKVLELKLSDTRVYAPQIRARLLASLSLARFKRVEVRSTQRESTKRREFVPGHHLRAKGAARVVRRVLQAPAHAPSVPLHHPLARALRSAIQDSIRQRAFVCAFVSVCVCVFEKESVWAMYRERARSRESKKERERGPAGRGRGEKLYKNRKGVGIHTLKQWETG